jgi:cytochrome c oxidase subunit I+III
MAIDRESQDLPNTAPRPAEELETLKRVWEPPRGFAVVTAVNNTQIGVFYIGAALLFFLLAGILALLMRTQLAFPENNFLDQDLYNQIFTMHGTMMMFLFAVPVVEAAGVLLLPQMLAARDLPFPRLSAFAFWAYLIGGLIFFGSLFFDLAPRGGWFMYPPLTSSKYSPGDNADFWLLGIGFIEISAIAGAIEIIVGVLRTRAPGMTLGKMPIFAWTMLIFAGMVIFAFPAVILATMLLELERAFDWPFFIAERGGDPLLWQHLFWFFGHPEVYIIFLPAAGMVSMMLPTLARTPLIGYNLIVVALIATGFFSFGLWVHHMFTTGLPALSVGFFSAASMAVSLPSGIQVFSWIATMANGRLQITAPSLFILGFLFIFVLGGLTGVMVAMVPFDWQVHDTYFVVAHFHYVLVGGMVFPLIAALYYWIPAFGPKPLSDYLGKWAFGLMFVGFNVAFLPMHLTGLWGMPRRVYTYSQDMPWATTNLISTIGAFTFAAGIAIVFLDIARRFRIGQNETAGNVWDAGTLEWLPNDTYATRSIPIVRCRYPLWDEPTISRDVQEGRYYLPGAPTGGRETIVTSAIEAHPEYVVRMPGPGWAHVLAAVLTALCFFSLTLKMIIPAAICGSLAIVCVIAWMWEMDPGPEPGPVEIGGGLKLPIYASGPRSHSWWAIVVLILVAAALYVSYFFSYLYLWTISPQEWPAQSALKDLFWVVIAALSMVASSALVEVSRRCLGAPGDKPAPAFVAGIVVAMLALAAGLGTELWGHWTSGLRATESSYGALTYLNAGLFGELVAALLIMGGFTAARHLTGRLNIERDATFKNTALLWHYTVGQGLFGLLLVHGFPRAVS